MDHWKATCYRITKLYIGPVLLKVFCQANFTNILLIPWNCFPARQMKESMALEIFVKNSWLIFWTILPYSMENNLFRRDTWRWARQKSGTRVCIKTSLLNEIRTRTGIRVNWEYYWQIQFFFRRGQQTCARLLLESNCLLLRHGALFKARKQSHSSLWHF